MCREDRYPEGAALERLQRTVAQTERRMRRARQHCEAVIRDLRGEPALPPADSPEDGWASARGEN